MASSELIQIQTVCVAPAPKPRWLRAKAPDGRAVSRIEKAGAWAEPEHRLRIGALPRTSASAGTINGDLMFWGTLHPPLGFCAVPRDARAIDLDEPRRVAELLPIGTQVRGGHQRQSR